MTMREHGLEDWVLCRMRRMDRRARQERPPRRDLAAFVYDLTIICSSLAGAVILLRLLQDAFAG